jgi:hypothetical protein
MAKKNANNEAEDVLTGDVAEVATEVTTTEVVSDAPVVNEAEPVAAAEAAPIDQAVEAPVETVPEIELPPASAYRYADPYNHICPGCNFDLALPAFKTKHGDQAVECCRCNTIFCPDAKTGKSSDQLKQYLAEQLSKLEPGQPLTITMPVRINEDFATLERQNIFDGSTNVLFTVGGIVLAARTAGFETVDCDSPSQLVFRKPETQP